ncbi:hypothetical protein RHMOL_Rhmol05G0163700 [Rhododendron molle]|uniref:Uncharacterized protein n=1 Tax=Rhododendron molle TaxID=49168 RepID=A0ACC0NQ13_RHOML|nr:hypothetical protein RHMOL_Rhmol05G0163700 [Rhododendron molle]
MDTMCYAFLTSLVRFNFLHAPKEMCGQNVEALRTLLALCHSETDALQDTWNVVLECNSRLEYIMSTPAITGTVMQGSNQISRDAILQSLRELAGKPAEQVFVNSIKSPSEAVVEFFTALCNVSAEELKQTPACVLSLHVYAWHGQEYGVSWRIILFLLAVIMMRKLLSAADDGLEPIVESAFENVEQGENQAFFFYFVLLESF